MASSTASAPAFRRTLGLGLGTGRFDLVMTLSLRQVRFAGLYAVHIERRDWCRLPQDR